MIRRIIDDIEKNGNFSFEKIIEKETFSHDKRNLREKSGNDSNLH